MVSGSSFKIRYYYANQNEGGFVTSIDSSNIPFSCRWMHFIFVKKDGIFSMYLDNVFFFTDTTVYPGFENFANINIGACQIVDDSLNTYSPFYGCIDDVRIYNHALSSNEISQIYKTSAENHGACLHR